MTLFILGLASHGCRYYFSSGAGKYVQHTNRIEKKNRGFSSFFFFSPKQVKRVAKHQNDVLKNAYSWWGWRKKELVKG